MSECLEGAAITEDVELLGVQAEDYHPVNPSESENKKEPYGGEELRAPCLLLAGDRDRDLDLERERLRDDLDRLLDLKTVEKLYKFWTLSWCGGGGGAG